MKKKKFFFEIVEHTTKRLKPKYILLTEYSIAGGFIKRYDAKLGVFELELDDCYGQHICDGGWDVECEYSNESGSRTERVRLEPLQERLSQT